MSDLSDFVVLESELAQLRAELAACKRTAAANKIQTWWLRIERGYWQSHYWRLHEASKNVLPGLQVPDGTRLSQYEGKGVGGGGDREILARHKRYLAFLNAVHAQDQECRGAAPYTMPDPDQVHTFTVEQLLHPDGFESLLNGNEYNEWAGISHHYELCFCHYLILHHRQKAYDKARADEIDSLVRHHRQGLTEGQKLAVRGPPRGVNRGS